MEILICTFIPGLFIFIGIMCIWNNTGKTAKLLKELVQFKRLDHKLDPEKETKFKNYWTKNNHC